MKGLYHAQRGHDDILKPYLVYQRKQVNDGVWRPVVAFMLVVIWGSFLIVSVCEYLGVK